MQTYTREQEHAIERLAERHGECRVSMVTLAPWGRIARVSFNDGSRDRLVNDNGCEVGR